MSKQRLVRFEITARAADASKLAQYLLKRRDVHIDNLARGEKTGAASDINAADELLGACERAIKILEDNGCAANDHVREVSYSDFFARRSEMQQMAGQCLEVLELSEKARALEEKIRLLNQAKHDFYERWLSLDIPMNARGTKNVCVLFVEASAGFGGGELEEKIYNASSCHAAVQIIFSNSKYTGAAVLCHNSRQGEVEAALESLGFKRPEHLTKGTVSRADKDCAEQLEACGRELSSINELLIRCGEYYNDLKCLYDLALAEKQRVQLLKRAYASKNVVCFSGWVPLRFADDFKFDVENAFSLCAVELYGASEKSGGVPVLIKSRCAVKPFSDYMKRHFYPADCEPDHFAVSAVFTLLTFALCVCDAGLGLIFCAVGAACLLFRRKGVKAAGGALLWLGASCVAAGLLFGRFFSNSVSAFFDLSFPAVWFDFASNKRRFLLVVLALCAFEAAAAAAAKIYSLVGSAKRPGPGQTALFICQLICGGVCVLYCFAASYIVFTVLCAVNALGALVTSFAATAAVLVSGYLLSAALAGALGIGVSLLSMHACFPALMLGGGAVRFSVCGFRLKYNALKKEDAYE